MTTIYTREEKFYFKFKD